METRLQQSIEFLVRLLKAHIVLLFVIVFVFLILYFLSEVMETIWEAKEEINKRPKEDMFWCVKHGPVRKKHCIVLFEGMKKRNGEEFLTCPVCFKESAYDNVDKKAKANG